MSLIFDLIDSLVSTITGAWTNDSRGGKKVAPEATDDKTCLASVFVLLAFTALGIVVIVILYNVLT